MEDCFPFPLWVEGDWNPGTPKLKNKLNIYFQSRKSNGGDCLVEYEASDGQRAVVRFKTQEVRQRVLEKQGHELKLGHGVLKLIVGLPQSEEKCNNFPGTSGEISSVPPASLPTVSDGADGKGPSIQTHEETMETDAVQEEVEAKEEAEVETVSVLLENVPEKMSREMMEMLVENISDTSAEQEDFSLEIIPDISATVVSFKNSKKVSHFLSKCSSSKMFKRNNLSARTLEVTKSVKVDKIPPNVSTDYLQLYFEREGKGEVEEAIKLEDEQSALITFRHHTGVNEVMKTLHRIQETTVGVYPYYKSLGTALYGKERPTLKLPDSFTESMDAAVWKFLQDKKLFEEINEIMAVNFCKVELQSPEVHISPLPSLLKQKGLKTMHINGWKEKAIATFHIAIAKFQSFECEVMPAVWEEIETEIRGALTEAVVIVPDMARGVVALAGLAEDVKRLKDVLESSVGTATRKLERQRDSITEDVPLEPSLYYILRQDGLPQKIAADYPELKMTYSQEGQKMILCGLFAEVYAAKIKVLEQIVALKRKVVEVEENVLSFLCEADKEELCNTLFTTVGIKATYETDDRRVQLVGGTDQDLCDAEKQLKTALGSYSIMVEDQNVLRKPEWQDLVTRLKESFNSPLRTVTVRRIGNNTKQEVVVSGFQDSVNEVGQKLRNFVSNNTIDEVTMDIKSRATLKFIQDHNRETLSEAIDKDVQVKFNYETRRPSITLQGPRAHVVVFKNSLQNMISSVHFDTMKIAKPGAKKFFKEKQEMLVGMAADKIGCVVQLVEESDEGFEDDKFIKVQVPGGVAIAICKADICQYLADAVVYAANEKLSQEGGLAGALLKAAGPKLQEQCDHIITTKGTLSPGEAVITNAGHLPCKYVIHAVCPRFDQTDVQTSVSILRQAMKQSLMLAEENGCLSMALPAIGSGNMGFPLDTSIQAITVVIREHCDVANTLKKIHLVANDDKTVQAMEDAVQKVFADLVYSQKATPKARLATEEKQHGTVQSTTSQDRVQTKEGLTIILSKGNIQDASTDAIVNTLGENLSLASGAVSKAILNAAGPELQNLVQAEAAGNNPVIGAVLITKGCNLKSKHVLHAIAPHWDKGKGKTEKVLEGIVEECLKKAEELQQRSIAFSAIGSGNLGFPKDFVASMFLGQVLSFSSKKPKHLQEVVIVLHPSDAQTTQAFYNEFSKKFTGVSASLKLPTNPAAASTQPGKGLFSKVTTINQGHEMRVGGVLLQVVTGDITQETTDVIVNSSNADFSLRSGVSKAILDAAGPVVDAECKQLGAQANKDMIMTQSGNLKSKKVIHIVGQTDVTKITGSVKAVLQMCAQNQFASVSFPALGTGQGGVSPSQVADAMLDAVADVVQQDPAMSLQLVRLVVFQAPMLTNFCSSMQKREGTGTLTKVPKTGAKRFKMFSQHGEKEDRKKAKKLSLEGKTFDPAIFHLCGDSQDRVEKGKRWIQNLFQQELTFQEIRDEAILDLSEEDHRKLRELQQSLQVSVKLEEGDPEASIIVEGLSRDILKAMSYIQDMLKKARTEQTQKRDAELVSNLVEWQYQQGSQYLPFDSLTNLQLQRALESQEADVTIAIHGQQYKVSLPDGPAVDSSGNQLQIKCIDKLEPETRDLPKHWSAMAADQLCLMIPLQAGTQEHKEVLGLFQATCPRQVSKIERVQNPCLWKNFQNLKQNMDQSNKHQNNERRLFHGTSQPTIDHINRNGFNRSYAGKNAAAYGNGTYFAVAASYSASNTYSVPDAQGQKYVYLCRVLTGDFTTGSGGMIVPPPKSNSSHHLYDSVTDNPNNPSMFIIFHDIQAYPEYLITFH
ncbi:hypothetical protein ANANG_G00277340 [Anguilla anguilla]|uniref:Poly [ADP-ribose] polymerase n=1 Tax=Anguilla anguilla TaxID=7936 RepID=A0A9D3LQ45_ANGAN|nr:hypothetical protein ANANG_G00277340 [Anguilla anguilla]